MGRPSFIEWATSEIGLYLFDKRKPTLAIWPECYIRILNHLFPGGDGPFLYDTVVWSAIKKSGKSELCAGLHIWFALFVDIPGEQYVISNDFQGAKSRVWRAIKGSLEKNPGMKQGKDWDVVGSEIQFSNGSTIKAIASDYKGEAGANHSFVSIDEAWGVEHDSQVRLQTEFAPVPTREMSTALYTGYQGFVGQSDFYHNMIDNGLAGESVPELADIDNGDGVPACWRNGRLFVYYDHMPRMPWHTPEYLESRKNNLMLSEYLRTWENRRSQSAEAFCTKEQWEKLRDPDLRALAPGDKRRVVLGADAATKKDCCALVGTTWNEEKKKFEVVYSKIWRPETARPIQITETMQPEIIRLHQEFDVAAVYYDPYQMAAISETCAKQGVSMVEFPQTSRRVQSDTHLHDLVWGNNFAHYGDPELQEHMLNAVSDSEGERGRRIVKKLTTKKIDGAVALSMSALGAKETLVGGKSKEMQVSKNRFYEG